MQTYAYLHKELTRNRPQSNQRYPGDIQTAASLGTLIYLIFRPGQPVHIDDGPVFAQKSMLLLSQKLNAAFTFGRLWDAVQEFGNIITTKILHSYCNSCENFCEILVKHPYTACFRRRESSRKHLFCRYSHNFVRCS